MANKIRDINDCVVFLSGMVMQLILSDEIWQNFGYKKRPRKGIIWSKLLPEKFELDNYIIKEVLIIGIIDLLNSIKETKLLSDKKLLIAIGMLDQILPTTKHLFNENIFLKNIIDTYKICSKHEKSKIHEPFILKAKEELSKKAFTKFMVGITALLGTPPFYAGLLLDENYIKNEIESFNLENKLKVGLSEEKVEEYTKLLMENIFS